MVIRVAILGAGIGREHLAAYRKLHDTFDVTRIVDQDEARAESLRQGDTFEVSDNLQAALDAPEVDVIDICLPPHLHVPVALRALEARKHVICEKPLATSLADVDRLRTAAQLNQKQVFPVFQYRWGPPLAQLCGLIAAGLTGQPQVGAIETHWSRGADYYAVPWRGTWAGEQGGAVLGHAIHNHDLMTHFMGPVASVGAMTTTRVNPIETEDCAAISFRLANGALATSSITLGAARDETRIRLVFERLTATSGTAPYAPGAAPWSFTARNPDHQPQIDACLAELGSEPIGYEGFFAAISDQLAGRASTAVTLEEGRASIALVTAIYHAARSGQTVNLPLCDNHPLYGGWQL
ncbi:Glucose--fructose oxidoreductase [Roseobacter fucihabitans]|uniref:Glucose--fructose oxidoreductase n=1 Tax=Roseobacter fucihabitans TaxID=1537242 RepID=A0ABZ2BQ37_9RHOB|nr:Gfo/Idh/MocA family oxidoreductase [Roseobacter litoralis]MBC6963652.1 Glucose--fructose oxidoreductase precursor [Roseobacter litoralis]